tara:strand:- start:1136 stop:2920 length:1785 start_codon:yes stop_codon:yes gene_type:complete
VLVEAVALEKNQTEDLGILLKEIYVDQSAQNIDLLLSQLMQIVEENKKHYKNDNSQYHLWDRSSVVLITYPDAVYFPDQSSLKVLAKLLINYIGNLSSVVHILPFLSSTSDGGFAVSSHYNIHPGLGDWEDLKSIAKDRKLMADIVLNHVSSSHPWVEDFIKDKKPCCNYILSPLNKKDWLNVFRPRNSELFTPFKTVNGIRNVWTTFGPDQIDLNWNEPYLLIEFLKLIAKYVNYGVSWLRLDAVGFIWKRPGGRCLHENEAHKLVKVLRILLNKLLREGVVITETNVPEKENISYLLEGDESNIGYNFPLPPLILEAIISNNPDLLNQLLINWPTLPKDTILLNFTACHDGIGLIPLRGLMGRDRIKKLLSNCEAKGGLVSHRLMPDGKEEPYELNISWWSAMKVEVEKIPLLQTKRFLLSQLFIIALPGIPAFYLQALLASENDWNTFRKTGHSRDLNRERFDAYDLFCKLNNPDSLSSRNIKYLQIAVEKRIMLKALNPESPIELISVAAKELVVFCRGEGKDKLWFVHNFTEKNYNLSFLDLKINQKSHLNTQWKDCLSDEIISKPYLLLKPYSVLWLMQINEEKLNGR